MKDVKSLQALIALMDDPDEQVYAHVRDRLLEIGPDAVELLESSWEEKDYGLLFQSRIETIILFFPGRFEEQSSLPNTSIPDWMKNM